MKKVIILFFFSVLITTGTLVAQNKMKFAHIDSQALLAKMPERDSAEKKFTAYAQEIQNALEEMQVEYNKKLDTYTNLPENTGD